MITLALLLCCSAAQAPPPVVLRATPPQPFIGQECRLTLELTTGQPPAMPLRLTVPWLRRPEVGFTWGLAPEAWRCQRSVPLAEGLPLELDGGPPVWAERIPGPGGPTYRLTWSLVAGEPDAIFQGKLTFPPVRLGEAVSNPVTIEIRKLPRPRQDLAPWNLGVGPFRVTAAVAPDRLQLGTETTLAVTVQGSAAALALVPPPDLTRQSAFADGPFLSESAPETWSADGTNRTFRFRLRPRQVTDQGVPPIRFSWFDPGRQDYVTQATASLPLAVLAPPPTPQASAVTEIPGLLAPTAALKRPPAWDPTDLGIWFLLLAPTLTALVLWWRGRGEEGPGLPASAHARRALRQLHRLDAAGPVGDVTAVVGEYLQARFGLEVAEPTPAEVAARLAAEGVGPDAVGRAAAFFQRCDATRFGPPGAEAPPLREAAAALIRELEGGKRG